jgi:hypothetical protein
MMRARSVPPCHGICVESNPETARLCVAREIVIPTDFLIASFGQLVTAVFLKF